MNPKVLSIHRAFFLDGEEVRLLDPKRRVFGGDSSGYIKLYVGLCDGKPYCEYLHRIKWCLRWGYLPVELDHKDRDRRNNLFDNLREVDRTLNNLNRTRSGLLPRGVEKRGNRFRARLEAYGKRTSLGTYSSPEEASKAVERAIAQL